MKIRLAFKNLVKEANPKREKTDGVKTEIDKDKPRYETAQVNVVKAEVVEDEQVPAKNNTVFIDIDTEEHDGAPDIDTEKNDGAQDVAFL